MDKAYVIDRIRLHWGKMPVKLVFSYGKVEALPFVIVRLSAGGVEGAGEILGLPNGFIGGLQESLLGRDARGLDALLPPTDNDADRMLCEAVSMALYDLVGRVSGLTLSTLLGGSMSDRVPLMPCIFPNTPEEAAEKSAHFFSQGYRYLKTKLIGDLEEDVARIRAIRGVAPEGVVLQGDANGGYKSLSEARLAVEECGAAGLDIFEDPLPGGVEDYLKLKGTPGSKVMVDRLARRTADLAEVLRQNAADVVGIHPVQPGGLSKAMQHVRLAQSSAVPVVIGGTGYTAVGSAAYQHLTAVATPDGPCGELGGVFDHGMPCSLVRESLPMWDGWVVLPDKPGTGVDIDEDALARFQEGHKEWRL